ncbi:MAG TPA: chloride channel protein [Gemmatimonadaceae bacterium]|nr:chloride channel protein [Gemmatimonadaceae bacterium]
MTEQSDRRARARRWRYGHPQVVLRYAGRRWDRILDWFARRELDEGAVLLVFGAVIGIAAGLAVVAFYRLIGVSHDFFIEWLGERVGVTTHTYYLPLLTAIGLWSAWALVRRFRVPDGQNIADVQLAVAKRNGDIRARPVAVRTVAAAVTIGSGGSAGSEGPVAVLGSAVGSAIGRVFRFDPRRVKILVGCGAAAGISGAFNAPFAGAFFALEQVLGSFSVGAFSPVVIASVAGALTIRPFLGAQPAIQIPSYGDHDPWLMVLLYPALGIACGFMSILFVRSYFAAGSLVARLPGPAALRPIAGGLIVGAAVMFTGGLLVGEGHLAIPEQLFGGLTWYFLISLALLKILVTVVTLQAGGSGGVFTPTLFIGAALGGGLGLVAAELFPGQGIHATTWGLVGMAGMVAGATRAPITALFMVFELTNDYTLVLPLMIVTVIAYLIARRYSAFGLYDGWLIKRGEHLAQGADRAIMDRIAASDALVADAPVVRDDAELSEIVAATAHTRHTTIPVLDERGLLAGVITYAGLREALLDRGELAPILLAADLAAPTEVVLPGESLRQALRKMNSRAIDALPVVESEDGLVYIGILTRADILAAYERVLLHEV